MIWASAGLQALGLIALIVGGVALTRHVRSELRLYRAQRTLDAYKQIKTGRI